MTFVGRPIAPFKTDFLRIGYTGALTNNPVLTLTGTLDNTSATLSSNQVTLYSGSHWRIEFSNAIIFIAPGSRDEVHYAYIYSTTDSAIIGTKGTLTECPDTTPSGTGYLTRGRATACALVLDSDISTSKTIQFQIEGNSTDFDVMDAASETRFQYGIVKIMELPA